MDTYLAPKIRTVKLRAALAVGAALSPERSEWGTSLPRRSTLPTRATLSAPGAAPDHALSHALAESLVLKNRSAVEGKAADIRYRRVIAP